MYVHIYVCIANSCKCKCVYCMYVLQAAGASQYGEVPARSNPVGLHATCQSVHVQPTLRRTSW